MISWRLSACERKKERKSGWMAGWRRLADVGSQPDTKRRKDLLHLFSVCIKPFLHKIYFPQDRFRLLTSSPYNYAHNIYRTGRVRDMRKFARIFRWRKQLAKRKIYILSASSPPPSSKAEFFFHDSGIKSCSRNWMDEKSRKLGLMLDNDSVHFSVKVSFSKFSSRFTVDVCLSLPPSPASL